MYVYIASPYTHPDEEVMRYRYEDALRAAKICLSAGLACYSPIAHWHPISMGFEADRPITFDQFVIQDLSLVASCFEFWVLALDGWEDSRGVSAEFDFARDMNKTTRIVTLRDMEQLCIYTRKVLETQLSSLSGKLLARMKSERGYPSSVTLVKS